MEYLFSAFMYVVPFLAVLTILVFVHEFGHFWVARRCGVKIDSFSIGFGRELVGRTDRHGTRWKLSLLPLGGYVKMFGDTDETSWNDKADTSGMSEADRQGLFANKPLRARAAVVAAGPAANFLFTIIIFSILFAIVGERFYPPTVTSVVAGSAAEAAGIKAGDHITSLDGFSVKRFEDIPVIVQDRANVPMTIVLQRDGQQLAFPITPAVDEETDRLGRKHKLGRLGIRHEGYEVTKQTPLHAVGRAFGETWDLIDQTGVSVWQMITGTRSAEEMGGIVSIAKMSGDTAKEGVASLVYFMGLLSINLGLINLFPIPVLDGGHLLFYAVEAVQGKPLGEVVMKYSFRFGLALVLTLAIFANWNDLVHLGFFDFIRDHIS